jgi:hypothetical protein
MAANPVLYAFDALDRASEFYEAFQQLPPLPRGRWISWPRYFLLCHAIEIGLKAFLASRGMPEAQLRTEFGHKIDPLMRRRSPGGLILGCLPPVNSCNSTKRMPNIGRATHAKRGSPCFVSIVSSRTHGNCFRGYRNLFEAKRPSRSYLPTPETLPKREE